MPKQVRYGLLFVVLLIIALSIPMVAAAAQGADPTPLVTATPVPPTSTPTPAVEVEVTTEATIEAEATVEPTPVQLPGGGRVEPVEGGEIAVGETVEGELTDDAPAIIYTFTGSADEPVRITLISDDFDPYLVLKDSDGNILDTDDDSAGNFDSRIGPFTLPEDGEYTLIAQSFAYYNNSGAGTGAFTLSIDVLEIRRIEYGQEINGSLSTEEYAQDYTFTGSAGDSVVISMTSDAFDTYLYLYDDSGFELTYNDDSGGTLNSTIGPFELPYTGTYTVSANSYSRSSTGAYTLSLSRVELQNIAYGDVVEIEVTEQTDRLFYAFEGNTGEVVNVYVESDGSVDASLTLNDPYNYAIATDQDSGRRYDPEIIDLVLNSSGSHMIMLDVASGTGSVTLTLERGVLPSLDEGTQTLNFSSSGTNPTRTLTFAGVAGTTVSLTFDVTGGGTGSPNVEVLQDGSSLAYVSASYTGRVSFDVTVPYDGEVLVRITEYSYANLSYEVSLTPAE